MAAVSMKSGLEGRNNKKVVDKKTGEVSWGLNEVRPRRPEQCVGATSNSGNQGSGLNEVRPRRPEQWAVERVVELAMVASQ